MALHSWHIYTMSSFEYLSSFLKRIICLDLHLGQRYIVNFFKKKYMPPTIKQRITIFLIIGRLKLSFFDFIEYYILLSRRSSRWEFKNNILWIVIKKLKDVKYCLQYWSFCSYIMINCN